MHALEGRAGDSTATQRKRERERKVRDIFRFPDLSLSSSTRYSTHSASILHFPSLDFLSAHIFCLVFGFIKCLR